MLTIRFFPMGRKRNKSYRVVVAQKHRHVSKKYIESLGWYNPYTKDFNLNDERVKYFVELNTDMSDSTKALFVKAGLMK